MNKKIILLIIAVFTMFLTPEVVKAAECVYGTVANGSWEKLVTIIVNDSDKSNMIARVKYNSEDSPIFGSVYGVNWYGVFGDASAFKGVEYDSDVVRASTWNLSYGPLDFAISVKLYADPSIYQDETQFNESVCPPRILVSTEVNSYWGLKTWLAMYFYADNLLTPNPGDAFNENFRGIYLRTSNELKLTEQSAKDDIDSMETTGCNTYDQSMKVIKRVIKENNGSCEKNSEFSKHYQNLTKLCDQFRSTKSYVSEDEAQTCSKACTRLRDDIATACNVDIEDVSCGSLGSKIVNWIFKIVKIVRYILPVLLIILSILDYIKALASDSEDEMKKVSGRFVKRLIAAVLIFLLPFILDFVLRIFNIPGLNADNPFCAN